MCKGIYVSSLARLLRGRLCDGPDLDGRIVCWKPDPDVRFMRWLMHAPVAEGGGGGATKPGQPAQSCTLLIAAVSPLQMLPLVSAGWGGSGPIRSSIVCLMLHLAPALVRLKAVYLIELT